MPLPLQPGMTESEMRMVMGKPSFISGKKLIYSHEHQKVIKNLTY